MDEEGDYDGPGRVPMSRGAGNRFNHKVKGKDFSDVLSPVTRYLRGQIGQPWDKVYSELVGALGAGNWPMQHILYQHILTRRANFLGSQPEGPLNMYDNGGRFHVDDRGLVAFEKSRNWRLERAKEPVRKIEIADRWFVEVDGIWYIGHWVDDVELLSPEWPNEKRRRFVKEKQANRKELKSLRNELANLARR